MLLSHSSEIFPANQQLSANETNSNTCANFSFCIDGLEYIRTSAAQIKRLKYIFFFFFQLLGDQYWRQGVDNLYTKSNLFTGKKSAALPRCISQNNKNFCPYLNCRTKRNLPFFCFSATKCNKISNSHVLVIL